MIPDLIRSPGGHGNPLQYSFLENPMDRGAWWATVHRAAQSQTWLNELSTHARPDLFIILYEILCIYLTLTLRQSYSLKNGKIYNIHIKWRGSTEQQELMILQRDWKLVVIRVMSLRGVSGQVRPDSENLEYGKTNTKRRRMCFLSTIVRKCNACSLYGVEWRIMINKWRMFILLINNQKIKI